MVRSLREGLVLSFEISTLALLVFLRFVELAFARCFSVIAQGPNSPKVQYSKTLRLQAGSERGRPLAGDHDSINEPQQSESNTPASRTYSMCSSPSRLSNTSATQHNEQVSSRETVKDPRVDSVNQLDIRSFTNDDCLLPISPSDRSIRFTSGHRSPMTSPTSATTISPLLNLVNKRHQAMLRHDGEANLREAAVTRQDGNPPTALSFSISRNSIELQPSVPEPSLLRNFLSPPRPVAHIELPNRVVSENLTHDRQHVLKSVEDESPKLTDSLSYLRTLAKANKGTADSASVITKSHTST